MKHVQPKVSVLMTTYNRDFARVKRALDSVLKQDYRDFEIILVDDGSQNGTEKELLNFVKNQKERITYIWHSNCGQVLSLNRAIANSSGDYIAFLDSDDEFNSNHLSECLKHMENYDLIVSYTDTIIDTPDDYYVPDKRDESRTIHVDEVIILGTMFGKSEIFRKLGFNEIFSLDSDLYERAAKSYRVAKLDFRTYKYYRNSPDSICNIKKKEHQHRG